MGLSSKQVSRSSSGHDWNQALLESQNLELPIPKMKKQQQQQQNQSSSSSETLKCPRCESTNTKFCYYNNYNKSQPRYLCRACKRHWTKGGTLRNVPVGGGRKNKRPKKSTTTATSTTTTTATATATNSTCTTSIRIQAPSLAIMDDHKNLLASPSSCSSSLYQGLIRPPPFLLHQNLMNNIITRGITSESKGYGGIGIGNNNNNNNGIFLGSSALSVPQNQGLLFPFSTASSSNFDTNPSLVSVSTSLQSTNNVYNNCGEDFKAIEEPTMHSIMATTTTCSTQPWEIPATTMEMSNNYWGWEDIDSLVSTDNPNNNHPWDDSHDIKP